MKTWHWALILFVAAAVCTALSVYLLSQPPQGDIAEIYSEGELYCRIDLKNPVEYGEYTVSSGDGSNIIAVDSGGIRVIHANCSDGLCVKQGYLRAVPVVCLPNRLVIKWQHAKDMQYDAIAR